MVDIKETPDTKALYILLLAIFIDVMGFGIVLPSLPFIIRDLAGNEFVYGVIAAVYSLTQFIFAPIWGYFSDKIGRRRIIVFGIFGTFLSFTLLAFGSQSLAIIFISRVTSGAFTAASLSTARAYIADTTTVENRTKFFGMLGAAFGLGFIAGPVIGGVVFYLSNEYGFIIAALLAAGLSLINFIGALLYLPETEVFKEKVPKEAPEAGVSLDGVVPSSSFKNLFFNQPKEKLFFIWGIILIFSTVNLAFSSFEVIFAYYAEETAGLREQEIGLFFGFVGITLVLTQIFIVPTLNKYFNDYIAITIGLTTLIVGILLLTIAGNVFTLAIYMMPIAVGLGSANPSISSALSKKADVSEQGLIAGVNQGLGSLMRVVGPLLGTFLFTINIRLPFYSMAIITSVGVLIAIILIVVNKRVGSPEEDSISVKLGTEQQSAYSN